MPTIARRSPSVHTSRRPRKARPALPRFEVRELANVHPPAFLVVDGFNVQVGSFLTRRGAQQSADRLNAAVQRALIASPRTILEGPSADAPHSADLYDGPLLDLDAEDVYAEDRADWVLMANTDDEPSDREYEEQELAELGIRNGYEPAYF